VVGVLVAVCLGIVGARRAADQHAREGAESAADLAWSDTALIADAIERIPRPPGSAPLEGASLDASGQLDRAAVRAEYRERYIWTRHPLRPWRMFVCMDGCIEEWRPTDGIELDDYFTVTGAPAATCAYERARLPADFRGQPSRGEGCTFVHHGDSVMLAVEVRPGQTEGTSSVWIRGATGAEAGRSNRARAQARYRRSAYELPTESFAA
jgi:hypothetical protein